MLPKEQLLRLSIEQENALFRSESKLERLNRFRSDYARVSKQLGTLPDKLEYPMMVPFSKKAFLPGKLVHTNEILVLLGDNWFVECTAKCAREIAERRIRQVDRNIEEIGKEHENISSNLKFTKEFAENKEGNREFEDILEFENESGEVTTLKGPNRAGGKMSKKDEEKAIRDFEARLAELQRDEEALDEEAKREETESNPQLLEDPPIDESLFENEIMKMPYTSTIQFHHTEPDREDEMMPEQVDSRTFSSPADIYNNSPERMRKSEELREEAQPKRKVRWGDNSEKVIEKEAPSLREGDMYAFNKIVKERDPLLTDRDTPNSDKSPPQGNRVVSKFKLAKMK